MTEKYMLEIDRYQHGLILNALNRLRNELVAEQRDTDFVDETMLHIMDAPTKRRKPWFR